MSILQRTSSVWGLTLALLPFGESNASAQCPAATGAGPVAAPAFVRNLPAETSWFAGPVIFDLDGDGANELIAALYSVRV
jgi:hypothetical protein